MKTGIAKIIISAPLLALNAYSNVAQAQSHYGFESNVTTFIGNGYHGSFWYGKNGLRARAILSRAVYPDKLTADGFKDKTLTYREVEFDFFFGANADKFRGFWLAAGFGRTDHEITSKSTEIQASISTNDLHFGGGYTFELTSRFTCNPWLGGDYHASAPDEVKVGNETWNPKKLELVAGLKLGIDF